MISSPNPTKLLSSEIQSKIASHHYHLPPSILTTSSTQTHLILIFRFPKIKSIIIFHFWFHTTTSIPKSSIPSTAIHCLNHLFTYPHYSLQSSQCLQLQRKANLPLTQHTHAPMRERYLQTSYSSSSLILFLLYYFI